MSLVRARTMAVAAAKMENATIQVVASKYRTCGASRQSERFKRNTCVSQKKKPAARPHNDVAEIAKPALLGSHAKTWRYPVGAATDCSRASALAPKPRSAIAKRKMVIST